MRVDLSECQTFQRAMTCNELDEDDEDGLTPARFLRLPVEYRCVYDRRPKRLRCFPDAHAILPCQ